MVNRDLYKYSKFVSLLFVLCTFVLTRQVPFSLFSPVMNLCVFLMVLISFLKKWISLDDFKIASILVIVPLALNLFYSIFIEKNEIINAVRFYFILIFVSFSYYLKVDKWAVRWFVILHLIQVLVLVCIFLFLVWVGFDSYLPIRFFFLEKEWGDVYSFDGILYKIQVKGNALLLFSFFLVNEYRFFKRNQLVSAVLLLGVIISGNFTFIAIAFCYLIYRYLNWKKYKSYSKYIIVICALFFMGIVSVPFIFDYVQSTLELKRDDSLATRVDQVSVLLDDLNLNFFRTLLGTGLGNTVEVITPYRDYRGVSYYELQAVYIFNQLGYVCSVLYLLYHLVTASRKWGNFLSIIVIYFLYLLYASTNPYMLDTNHFLVIVVLNSLVFFKKDDLRAQELPVHID